MNARNTEILWDNCPSSTPSTTNPKKTGLEPNQNLCGERPATEHVAIVT